MVTTQYLAHIDDLEDAELDSGTQLVLGLFAFALCSYLRVFAHISCHLLKLGKVLVHALLQQITVNIK